MQRASTSRWFRVAISTATRGPSSGNSWSKTPTLLRAAQAVSASHPQAALHVDAATVIAYDAGLHADATARTLLASMQTGDALRTSLAGLRRILKVAPVNTVAARRRIADAITDRKAYPFGARA